MTEREHYATLNLIAALIEKCKTPCDMQEAAKLIRDMAKNISR